MVTATLQHLRNDGVERLGVIAFGAGAEWRDWRKEAEIVDLHATGPLALVKLRFLLAAVKFRRFYCLGADLMDGYYSRDPQAESTRITLLATLASAAGLQTSILGFSFNDRPTPGAISALQRLPQDVSLHVRDPVSHERLNRLLGRPVKLVADVAFLLRAQDATEIVSEVTQWITAQRSASRIVLGVNLNHRLFLRADGSTLENVIEKISRAITVLAMTHKSLSLLMLPHDYRPYKAYPGDADVAKAIWSQLPVEVREHSLVVTRQYRAAEAKAICRRLDLLISGLMHLAIGCLEQGTPVACLSYQGKFEGLMNHFGLIGLITEPEQMLEGDNLAKFVTPLILRRESIRSQINSALPRIRQLAQANFA